MSILGNLHALSLGASFSSSGCFVFDFRCFVFEFQGASCFGLRFRNTLSVSMASHVQYFINRFDISKVSGNLNLIF